MNCRRRLSAGNRTSANTATASGDLTGDECGVGNGDRLHQIHQYIKYIRILLYQSKSEGPAGSGLVGRGNVSVGALKESETAAGFEEVRLPGEASVTASNVETITVDDDIWETIVEFSGP